MEGFSGLFKKENMSQLALAILFIIYLIMGYKTPEMVASIVDTLVGKIVIFIMVIVILPDIIIVHLLIFIILMVLLV